MAKVIVKLRVMPESPEIDLNNVIDEIKSKIEAFNATLEASEKKPIAFGLNALEMILLVDEEKGSTEQLEEDIKKIDGVQSVEVIDVRRTIG